MRTLQQLAQEALDVQDACNIMGVSRSFAEAMVDLSNHVKGTDAIASHPITQLWIEKLASMSGWDIDKCGITYERVRFIIEGGDHRVPCS